MRFKDPTLLRDDGTPHPEPLSAYVPPPLRRGKIPRWLKSRLQPRRWGRIGYGPQDVLYSLAQRVGSAGWLDHWGTTIYANREWFVSEPYTLTSDDLRSLLTFADILDLDVTIHAASHHFPTATVRIMFEPRTPNSGGSFLAEPQFFSKRVKGATDEPEC